MNSNELARVKRSMRKSTLDEIVGEITAINNSEDSSQEEKRAKIAILKEVMYEQALTKSPEEIERVMSEHLTENPDETDSITHIKQEMSIVLMRAKNELTEKQAQNRIILKKVDEKQMEQKIKAEIAGLADDEAIMEKWYALQDDIQRTEGYVSLFGIQANKATLYEKSKATLAYYKKYARMLKPRADEIKEKRRQARKPQEEAKQNQPERPKKEVVDLRHREKPKKKEYKQTYKKPYEISIVYNVLHAKYVVNGETGGSKIYDASALNTRDGLKVEEKLAISQRDIPEVFQHVVFGGLSKKALKKYDPNIVKILFEEYGSDSYSARIARDYMNSLEGKSVVLNPFKVIYNLKSLNGATYRNGKRLSTFDKLRIINLAKDNDCVASVIEPMKVKVPMWKKMATAAATVVLAITAGIGTKSAWNLKSQGVNVNPKITDNVEPGVSENDVILSSAENENVYTNTFDEGKATTYTTTTRATTAATTTRATTAATTRATTAATTTRATTSATTRATTEETTTKATTTTTETQTGVKEDKEETKGAEIFFGSVMQLPEGLEFKAGMSGGNAGKIGSEFNPINAYYVIDRSIKIQDGTLVDYKYGLNGTMISNDSSMVHISIVEGAKSLQEAMQIVKDNIKAADANSVHGIGQRGWVSTDEIRSIFEKQQEQRTRNNKRGFDRD